MIFQKLIKIFAKNRIVVVVVATIIAILTYSNFSLIRENSEYKRLFIVKAVSDGDSFMLTSGQQIRLYGLDAPELALCGGKEAKDKLTELILSKPVRAEGETFDTYGRKVAMVYSGNTFINEIMIREGFASCNHHYDVGTVSLRDACAYAKENRIGIYSSKCYSSDNEVNPKCPIKANIGRSGEKIYHYPGCQEYKTTDVELFSGDQWFCSEKEAQGAGFKKAPHCYDKVYTP